MELNDRIIELETKSSYQEHLIQELNEVVISQQKQMDALETSMQRMSDYLKNNQGSQLARPDEEVPPPHY
ncbi:MAG: SlyX family protein [Mariprofundaceae bacterium]|nr:SlyX family protein [Mariprofundaceae bacterium]